MIYNATVSKPPTVEPRLRKEVVHLTGGPQALRWWIEQVPKRLIRKQCPSAKDNLRCAESEGSGRPGLLRLESCNQRLAPKVVREGPAQPIVQSTHKAIAIIWR